MTYKELYISVVTFLRRMSWQPLVSSRTSSKARSTQGDISVVYVDNILSTRS